MLSLHLPNAVLQTLFGIILDALTLGILFSRISHPMQRSHSIFLSENAVILRRDGILKFCFRCADIKITQVRSLQGHRLRSQLHIMMIDLCHCRARRSARPCINTTL